jgi:hypothetical protein
MIRRYSIAALVPILPIILPIAALSSCSGLPLSSQPSPVAQMQTTTSTEPPHYDAYAQILKRYVNPKGRVDYQGLQANSQGLKAFNQSLGAVPTSAFQGWSNADQIAFLINAYNAFTLQSIIDQQPLKASIRDIPGVWRIRRFAVAGQSKTLDDIEHGMLRAQYKEPRVHAALNCTAMSCPPLRIEPYQGDRLDAQLDDQVRQWLSSPYGLRIDRQQNRVYLSAIFDWFGKDWIPTYGVTQGFTGNEKQRATLNFISRYVSSSDRDYLKQGNYQVSYMDYDWSLNQQ